MLLFLGLPNLNFLKLLWSRAFGLGVFSLPASDYTIRRYSTFGLLMIGVEDVPQVIILFVYSSTVTGWSVTALVSGIVGIIAIGVSTISASWTYHKSQGSAHAEGFGALKLRSQTNLNSVQMYSSPNV